MLEVLHTVVLSLHVLGAAVIVGGIFASLLILVKDRFTKDNLKFLQFLWKFMTPSIGLQILTGIYLASSEWEEFGKNPLLWAKIGLLVVDGFLGGKVLQAKIEAASSKHNKEVEISGAKRLIWLSLIIFITISTLGVFLAEGYE